MNRITKLASLFACLATLTGCPDPAVYNSEDFAAADSPFQLKVKDELAIACESARRSLLGQGYLIETANGDAVKGRKGYRSSGKLSTFIEMNITCVSDYEGSTLYANGVLSTYDLKTNTSAASVGLSAVGSISLPIGQSADSMVKVAEETINDKAFYGRFFSAVDYTLKDLRKRRTDEVPIPPTQPAPLAIPIEQGPVATSATPQAAPQTVESAPGAAPIVPASTEEPAPPASAPGAAPVMTGPAIEAAPASPSGLTVTTQAPVPTTGAPAPSTVESEPLPEPVASPAIAPATTETGTPEAPPQASDAIPVTETPASVPAALDTAQPAAAPAIAEPATSPAIDPAAMEPVPVMTAPADAVPSKSKKTKKKKPPEATTTGTPPSGGPAPEPMPEPVPLEPAPATTTP